MSPPPHCPVCTGREGTAKRAYPSEDEARDAAEHIRSEGGPSLVVYRCPYFHGWHLSRR